MDVTRSLATAHHVMTSVAMAAAALGAFLQVGNDWFLVANDFAGYLDAQAEVDRVYKDKDEWTRRSVCM